MVMLGALPEQDDRLEARRFSPLPPTHLDGGLSIVR
jgi:hypothetical protein